MTQVVSVSISDDFFNLAKENNLSWAEAMRIGLSVMFGDRNIKPYDNNLNVIRKMNFFRDNLEDTSEKLDNTMAKVVETTTQLRELSEDYKKKVQEIELLRKKIVVPK